MRDMNWDDPAARLALIERVGITEYNRQLEAHQRASVVAHAGGYEIRAVHSGRFGRLYMVDGLNRAWSTLEQAVTDAEAHPLSEGPY